MSNAQLKAKFSKMSTGNLINKISKGKMSKREAIQAAEILDRRIPL